VTTLDVGCGNRPWGDVNCDINIGYTPEGGDQKERGIFINPHKIKNFVKCDAQYLPFKNNIFNKVFCFHVIEHINNPYLLLKELIRVSHSSVTIKCPHRFSKGAKLPHHKHYFTKGWFGKTLKNFKCKITATYVPYPFYFGLVRPNEIIVKIQKV